MIKYTIDCRDDDKYFVKPVSETRFLIDELSDRDIAALLAACINYEIVEIKDNQLNWIKRWNGIND